MNPVCDRCGRGHPYATHFWAVNRGLLCDDCNAEWAVFRYHIERPIMLFAGLAYYETRFRTVIRG